VVRDGSDGGDAIVRVYVETPELDTIEEVVKEFFEKMGCKAEIEVKPKRAKYYVNIKTRRYDSLLIGKNGKTLEALDYLLNLLIKRKIPNVTAEIDISGYKERKRQFLINKALAIARQVRETGREMRMDGLNQREIRLVRNALKREKDIKAYMVGRGENKVLVIAPAA
jgi:spoIIIJ-associated protein